MPQSVIGVLENNENAFNLDSVFQQPVVMPEENVQEMQLTAQLMEQGGEKVEPTASISNSNFTDSDAPIAAKESVLAGEIAPAAGKSSIWAWSLLGGLVIGGGVLALAAGSKGKGGASSNKTANEADTKSSPHHEHKIIEAEKIQPIENNDGRTYLYKTAFFKQDSDGDGLTDALDPQANLWNVSDRDLRAFSTLVYRDGQELSNLFERQDVTAWGKINRGTFHSVFSEQESRNFMKNWQLLEFKNTDDVVHSGLDYAIFGNGQKADGSYQNLVFAFRGTKNQLAAVNDYLASLKALRGKLPTQAKELEKFGEFIDRYNPDSVYATGHSLGGYLTQYLAGYVMQQKPEYAEKLKHTAIFNPLRLITDDKSAVSLKFAKEKTELFVSEKLNYPDITNHSAFYKTNSYVINGEFLADGIPKSHSGLAGAILGGLTGGLGGLLGGLLGLTAGSIVKQGTYDNAIRFEPIEKGWFDGHKMARFYEKTEALDKHFAFGSRYDNWAKGENPYLKDTDKDGIADVVEKHFGSDPEDARSLLALATEIHKGKPNGDEMIVHLYKMDSQQADYVSQFSRGAEHIYGNDKDNKIDGGQGNNVLFGGSGKDIFVVGNNDFAHQERNFIGDFDHKSDKLDLTALKLGAHTAEELFSRNLGSEAQVTLHWDSSSQQLLYVNGGRNDVIVQFLNPTELFANNLIV